MINKKTVWTLLVVMVFVLSTTIPVFAQGEVEPTVVPTETPGEPGDNEDEDFSFTHPLISLLDEYFGVPVSDDPTLPVDEEVISTGEQIAGFLEEGMGFGLLVKLYAIAGESSEACLDQPDCVPVSVDELVTMLKSGDGIGQLMKEYGKPSMLGVGHVRKSVQETNEENNQNNNGNGNDNNGNGNDNNNGNGNDNNNGNDKDKDKEKDKDPKK